MRTSSLIPILAGIALAAALASVCSAGEQTATNAKPTVDLDNSFRISQKEGGKLSHTPALVYTTDGKRMITATAEGELVVFDRATMAVLHRNNLPEGATDGVSVSQDGNIAAVVLKGGALAIVDTSSGKVLTRDDKATAKWVALDPSGKRLALSNGKTLELRTSADLSIQSARDLHEDDITALAWDRQGGMLASTSAGGSIVVIDSHTGTIRYKSKKQGALYAVDFHPSQKTLAYGGHERKVYEVDLETGNEQVISGNQPYWITCLGYSPDGSMLGVGDESCDVWLYKVGKAESVFHSKHHVECWLSQVSWTPDSETFLFACRPNSHAGRPALYTPLSRLEAARSPEVRASRRLLLDSIEKELGTNNDEEARKQLEQLQVVLNNEEKLDSQQVTLGSYGQQQINLASGSLNWNGNQINQQQVAYQPQQQPAIHQPVDTKLLPAKINELLTTHNETQTRNENELQQTFNINQWKVSSFKGN